MPLYAGLCGLFDGDARNDLILPDGKIYPGPGKYRGEQPRGFNQAWRVQYSDRIFHGVSYHPYSSQSFCECTHNGGSFLPTMQCGPNELLELCDLDPRKFPLNCTSQCLVCRPLAGDDITEEILTFSMAPFFDVENIDIQDGWMPPVRTHSVYYVLL